MSAEKYKTLAEYENALIVKAREQAQAEWQKVEKDQRLANLHAELGYKSASDLIKAIQAATGAKGAAKSQGTKRARITPEIANKVKELKNGGKGPSEIARSLGISIPSVYNILKKA